MGGPGDRVRWVEMSKRGHEVTTFRRGQGKAHSQVSQPGGNRESCGHILSVCGDIRRRPECDHPCGHELQLGTHALFLLLHQTCWGRFARGELGWPECRKLTPRGCWGTETVQPEGSREGTEGTCWATLWGRDSDLPDSQLALAGVGILVLTGRPWGARRGSSGTARCPEAFLPTATQSGTWKSWAWVSDAHAPNCFALLSLNTGKLRPKLNREGRIWTLCN